MIPIGATDSWQTATCTATVFGQAVVLDDSSTLPDQHGLEVVPVNDTTSSAVVDARTALAWLSDEAPDADTSSAYERTLITLDAYLHHAAIVPLVVATFDDRRKAITTARRSLVNLGRAALTPLELELLLVLLDDAVAQAFS